MQAAFGGRARQAAEAYVLRATLPVDHRAGAAVRLRCAVVDREAGRSARMPPLPWRPPRRRTRWLTNREQRLANEVEPVLAEEHRVADEEGRRAEDAARDRFLRGGDELRLHLR